MCKQSGVGECSFHLTQMENLSSSNWASFFDIQLFWQSCIRLLNILMWQNVSLAAKLFSVFHRLHQKQQPTQKQEQISTYAGNISQSTCVNETDVDICLNSLLKKEQLYFTYMNFIHLKTG